MKIAVVGSGAVGIYYGSKLFRAGHEVSFLVRSDYQHVQEHGFSIFSPEGNFQLRPQIGRTPGELGPADLVIVCLKTTANSEFSRLLPPLVRPDTMVLTLQNGLSNEAALASLFGADAILGGLCFVCLNRIGPGQVSHLAHGQIVLGEYQRPPQERTRLLLSSFIHAGINCHLTENLERAHWDKLTWNIPFNGLGVASSAGYTAVLAGQLTEGPNAPCLTTDRLLGEPAWARLVRDLMLEVIAIGNALGLELPSDLVEQQIDRTRKMGAYKPSTVLDYEQGRALELESLFLKPLDCARRAGIAAPRLIALCSILSELDRQIKG